MKDEAKIMRCGDDRFLDLVYDALAVVETLAGRVSLREEEFIDDDNEVGAYERAAYAKVAEVLLDSAIRRIMRNGGLAPAREVLDQIMATLSTNIQKKERENLRVSIQWRDLGEGGGDA